MQLTINIPDNLAQEVIDFVEFLQSKYKTNSSNNNDKTIRWEDDDNNLNDLILAQSLSVQDWDNEDDEVWNHVPTL